MQAPAGAIDINDDGMMNEPVHDSRGNHGIPEVVAQGLEIDIGGQPCGEFPVSGVDDLEEERRLFYVAMTRAMDILCLTWAQKRRISAYFHKSKIL